jgi:two-component system chemotaxis response regulator CheY
MITALGKEDTVKEAVLSGASGFIVKPFVQEQVLRGLSAFK